MSIALVDTSIFCNIIPVPGRDQKKQDIRNQLKIYIENQVTLLLPVGVIFETGNHIAQLADGRLRRQTAQHFVAQVQQALDDQIPWTVSQPLLEPEALREYLVKFPEHAVRKISLVDLSIIKEFERQCALNPARGVFIWSLDEHLQDFNRPQADWTRP